MTGLAKCVFRRGMFFTGWKLMLLRLMVIKL